jgi:hypothetical protein
MIRRRNDDHRPQFLRQFRQISFDFRLHVQLRVCDEVTIRNHRRSAVFYKFFNGQRWRSPHKFVLEPEHTKDAHTRKPNIHPIGRACPWRVRFDLDHDPNLVLPDIETESHARLLPETHNVAKAGTFATFPK